MFVMFKKKIFLFIFMIQDIKNNIDIRNFRICVLQLNYLISTVLVEHPLALPGLC